MEENFSEEISKKWYKKWWGVVILVAGGLILSFSLIIGGQAYYYYRQIKNGKSPLPSKLLFQKSNTITAASGAPDLSKLNPADEPTSSSSATALTIVGFFDFECPHSKEGYTAMRQAQTVYGDKVNFIFRNFPLTDIHQNSMSAAIAGECAHAQNKFWQMSDKIFNDAALTKENFELYAAEIGLDAEQFSKCLNGYQGKGAVLKDLVDSQALGVVGTPTWFINGEKIEGVLSAADFKKIIDFFSSQKTTP